MKERTIEKLASRKERVYIFLKNSAVARLFLENADREGFTFCDGVRPTEREADFLYRIMPEKTICYVGLAGRMAFHYKGFHSVEPVVWVDYGNYLLNERRYIIKKAKPKRPGR